METNDWVILIWCAIACFFFGQVEASGNIGNRAYSIWYETRFLIEKKGICRFIYFKPKHFGRFTLYEVTAFFSSFLCFFLFLLLGLFRYADWISSTTLHIIACSMLALFFFSAFAIAIINDVGSRRDEKKKFYLQEGERQSVSFPQDVTIPNTEKPMADVIRIWATNRNNSYFTIHNLWDSYRTRLKEARNDPQKQNQVHIEYIEYFKNMENLVVIKENKNGSLQLKIQK